MKKKNSMTTSVLEPVILRLVAYRLNRLRYYLSTFFNGKSLKPLRYNKMTMFRELHCKRQKYRRHML
jgi:hypothetical protein